MKTPNKIDRQRIVPKAIPARVKTQKCFDSEIAGYLRNMIAHRERDVRNTPNERVAQHGYLDGQLVAYRNALAYLNQLRTETHPPDAGKEKI